MFFYETQREKMQYVLPGNIKEQMNFMEKRKKAIFA